MLVAYQKVGLGWFVALLKLPLIRWCIDVLYKFVSANRYTISKDAGGRAPRARSTGERPQRRRHGGGLRR